VRNTSALRLLVVGLLLAAGIGTAIAADLASTKNPQATTAASALTKPEKVKTAVYQAYELNRARYCPPLYKPLGTDATATCYPASANYETGSCLSTSRTQTSTIQANDYYLDRGWAVFNITSIPDDANISDVTLHISAYEWYYPYWTFTPITWTDPRTSPVGDVYNDIDELDVNDAGYYTYQTSDPVMGYNVYSLGPQAAIDIGTKLTANWFAVGVCSDDAYGGTYYGRYEGWAETNPPYIVVTYTQTIAGDVGATYFKRPTDGSRMLASGQVIEAFVKNFGTAPADFSVAAADNHGWTGSASVSGLAAGASQMVTFNWAGPAGMCSLRVYTQLGGDPNATNDTIKYNRMAAAASTDSIVYDDGTMANASYFYAYDNRFAQSFTPENYPVTVNQIADWILGPHSAYWPWPDNSLDSCLISIYVDNDANGQPDEPAVYTKAVTQDTLGDGDWLYINPDPPIVINQGSFWVGFSNLAGGGEEGQGMDVSTGHPTTEWYKLSGTWYNADYNTGDDMFRAHYTYVALDHDAGIKAVLSPTSSMSSRYATFSPTATFKNYGQNAETNVAAACTIFGAGAAVLYHEEVTFPALAAGQETTHVFTAFTPAVLEDLQSKFAVELSGDMNPGNNVMLRTTTWTLAHMTGGPDADGYRWIDSDTVGGPTYSWIDITGATLIGTGDDSYFPATLGFPFIYRGITYSGSIQIGCNGWFSFGAGVYGYDNNFPYSSNPQPLLGLMWDDLYVMSGIGGIYTKTVGTAPNRQFAIIWQDAYRYYTTPSTVSFEAVLNEADGSIVFQYADVDYGNAAYNNGIATDIGIQNANGTVGLSYFNDNDWPGNLLSAGRAIKWVPPTRDVALLQIVSPPVTVNPSTPYNITLRCQNLGTVPQTFDIYTVITGATAADTVYNDLRTGLNLAVGATSNFNLSSIWIPAGGTYHITSWCVASGDIDRSNDTLDNDIVAGSVDIACNAITVPAGNLDTIQTVIPTASFTNNGSVSTLFEATYTIDDGTDAVVYTDVQTLTLAAGATQVLPFIEWPKPHALGSYTAKCSVYVAGDQNLTNNVKTKAFQVLVITEQPGWYRMADTMPSPQVKDGGGLTYHADNNLMYSIKGGKNDAFFQYSPTETTWTALTNVPTGTKPVGKGAAIAAGGGYVYVMKGNSTRDFYAYNTVDSTWAKKHDIPLELTQTLLKGKTVKGGGSMAYVAKGDTEYVYVLKGYGTDFYRYDIAADTFKGLVAAPYSTKAKYDKGSWIVYDGTQFIYVMQAKYNALFKYDVLNEAWVTTPALTGMPLVGFSTKSKKVGDGSCAAWNPNDEYIFSMKGNNTQEAWKYTVGNDTWTQLETIPQAYAGGKKKKVKAGAGTAYYPGTRVFFVQKGNKSNQFYKYVPGTALYSARPNRDGVTTAGVTNVASLAVSPSPMVSGYATVRYSLPKAGMVDLNIFDVTGRTVMTRTFNASRTGATGLDLRNLSAGVYLVKLSSDGFATSQKLVVER
jgi:hypothetical protein